METEIKNAYKSLARAVINRAIKDATTERYVSNYDKFTAVKFLNPSDDLFFLYCAAADLDPLVVEGKIKK